MKNKILSIILIVIALIFSFSASCFAADDTVYTFNTIINDNEVVVNVDNSQNNANFLPSMIEEYSNYIIIKYGTSSTSSDLVYLLFYKDTQTLIYDNFEEGRYTYLGFYSSDGSKFGSASGKLDKNTNNLTASSNGLRNTYSNSNIEILYCTNDIYNSNGDLVFQAPPQVAQATILAPIVEEMEMNPLAEVVEILPTVIIVIVGLLAIRKAIMWTQTILRKS